MKTVQSTLLSVSLLLTVAFVVLSTASNTASAQDFSGTIAETLTGIGEEAAKAAAEEEKSPEEQAEAREEAISDAIQGAFGGRDAFIFNTLLFLIGGFLVMWMAAGFAMLEAGMVRSKNVAMQCTKNIALYSIAGIMFYLVGYTLMYPGDNWIVDNYFGAFGAYPTQAVGADISQGDYSDASDWFLQMVLCATTASIVSGTNAERTTLRP